MPVVLSVKPNVTPSPPVFALVAGELSGDTLGADLMQGLLNHYPDARFVGIGGPKMLALGLESWAEMSQLSIMGFAEVLRHLPKLLKLRARLAQQMIQRQPQAFIGIDAPDFNLGLAKKLKQAGLVTIQYVSPSIWAWRPKRIHKIKRAVSGMLVLFPFEKPLYEQHAIPVACVGHPLAQQVPKDSDQPALITEAKHTLGLHLNQRVIGVLPGSRQSEVATMGPIYLATIAKVHQAYPDYQFVMPCVNNTIYQQLSQLIAQAPHPLPIHLVQQPAQTVMMASELLLITSGTATLESALMARPMLIAIKVHWLSYFIMQRLARLPWVGLPNILAQRQIVPEFIQDQAQADALASAMLSLIADPQARDSQRHAFQEIKTSLSLDSGELAAQAVLQWSGLTETVN